MNTESEIPVTGLYADEAPSGYIEPPTNTQFHAGVEPEMTLPAAWWNYFVNLFTNTNIKAKEDITAILTELNNALTGGGVTPDPEAANQLLTLLRKGSGSTVNADKVRDTTPGTRGLQYLAAAAVSNIAALILADLKTVDGSGSGLDADKVRSMGLPFGSEGASSDNTLLCTVKSVTDANNIDGNGVIFSTTGSPTNFPTVSFYAGIQFYIAYNPDYKIQIAHGTTNGTLYLRSLINGVWGAWQKIWHSGSDGSGSGSGLDADLLDGQHGSYYAPKANPTFTGTITAPKAQIANTFIDSGVNVGEQDGFLIRTDIPLTANVMTFLEFTMNVYEGGYPCIGIVQCYPYEPFSAIIRSGYSAIGSAPPYCRIFFTDSALCFWIPKTGNAQTLHPVLHTNASGYKIVSTTAASLPASRDREVTANVLLPWSSNNDGSGSGLDADTVDGSHYNATDILTKLKTVDGPGSGLDADTVDGLDAATIKQAVTGIQVLTADPSNPANGTIWLRSNV